MAIFTTRMPSGPSRTLAEDGISGLRRAAADMPMPTSQLPSRRAPAACRLSQPNRRAPSRMQGTSLRVENGTFFSGSSAGSLRTRNSIGSIFNCSASSSMAHSKASWPTASPGARIAEAIGMLRLTSRWRVTRFCAA